MKKFILISVSFFLVVLISCNSSNQTANVNNLTSEKWELVSISGKQIDAGKLDNGIPYVNFTAQNIFTGFTGCNSFVGTYAYENNRLKLDPGSITKMSCGDDLEIQVLTAIKQVTDFKLSANNLLLMNGTTEVMKFIPKK